MYTATYVSFTVAMIAILNPIGNAALYLGMTSDYSAKQQRQTAFTCALTCMVIMLLSIWVGQPMLSVFGISIGAFSVAGGIIVLLIGLSMLKSKPHTHEHHQDTLEKQTKDSVAVVPLAIPIVAGPGAITTIIAHAAFFTTATQRLVESGIVIALALSIGLVFLIAPFISRILGEAGLKIVTRIMGMILSAIAIQIAASGIVDIFHIAVS